MSLRQLLSNFFDSHQKDQFESELFLFAGYKRHSDEKKILTDFWVKKF